jgi:tRNA G18 (ribose-2'-O)-methylase SpoU
MDRHEFMSRPRRPITVVLDRVRQNYNIGAIFRLCDAFLVERLIICGTTVNLRKRRLVQAACGAQHWVPWLEAADTAEVVTEAKAAGNEILVVEQTSNGIRSENLSASGRVYMILGAENGGVDQKVIDMADIAVTIPILGMANSLNVASAAAIVLHRLSLALPIR